MSASVDTDSAFPREDCEFVYPGLSRREYFAAAILSGTINHGYTAENSKLRTAVQNAIRATDILIEELDK